MIRRLFTLIWKELLAQFRDAGSRTLIILPVLIEVTLFPFAATLEVKNNTLAIYNQDVGAHSIELMQRLAHAKSFIKLNLLHSMREVHETIDNQQALVVIVFPNDFSRQIESGKQTHIQAIFDGRRSNAAQIVASYIESVVNHFKTSLPGVYQGQSLSIISEQNWFNPNLEYQWFILPTLIAIITSIGSLVVTAMSVAREREQGTFEQLLVSPLTPDLIMLGKMIPALIISIIQASIILFASIFFYKVPFQGSLPLLYFCLLCYALALSGTGLLISSISATQQQAFLGVFAFLMPAIMLSGYISPIENIPEPLQSLTWINPIRHFIFISKGIYLKGFGMAQVWNNLWPLLVIALMTLSLAYFIFKRHLK